MRTDNTKSGFRFSTQLYTLVFSLTLAPFIWGLWISIDSTQDYLNNQMATHARDTATSLGLSISPYLDEDNLVIAETMIAAIFDSGYYESLTLTNMQGEALIHRQYQIKIDGVPDWFISLFPLHTSIESSEISDGWQVVGTLNIQSHPGASYQNLWQYAISHFESSLGFGVIALLMAHFLLRLVLNPLIKVEAQANSVCKKQFPLIESLPKTRELRTVVTAMNNMVSSIQQLFDDMSLRAESLSKAVYIDDLTQLPNRKALDSQFEFLSQEMSANELATIAMIQLPSLNAINQDLGYQAGDNYVSDVAKMVEFQLSPFSDAKLYRIGGSTLLFMLKGVPQTSLALCKQLSRDFMAKNSSGYPDGFATIMAIDFTLSDKLSDLLAKLDILFIQQLYFTEKDSLYVKSNQLMPTYGFLQWSSVIKELLKQEEVDFMYQPIKALDNEDVLYCELFSAFKLKGEVISNNQLYAMAERFNKSVELDRLVLSQLAKISDFSKQPAIAVNLTRQTLHDLDFRNWLTTFCQKHSESLPELVFEINEEAILASIESSMVFIQRLKDLNIKVCIDRFGSSFTSFKYLKGLNIDYLKIDGAYIRELTADSQDNHFIQAVVQIGHSVGIKVLAGFVENPTSLNALALLSCDGVQGNHIQKPLNLLSNTAENSCTSLPFQVKSQKINNMNMA